MSKEYTIYQMLLAREIMTEQELRDFVYAVEIEDIQLRAGRKAELMVERVIYGPGYPGKKTQAKKRSAKVDKNKDWIAV